MAKIREGCRTVLNDQTTLIYPLHGFQTRRISLSWAGLEVGGTGGNDLFIRHHESRSTNLNWYPIRIFLCSRFVFTTQNEDLGQIGAFVIFYGPAYFLFILQ